MHDCRSGGRLNTMKASFAMSRADDAALGETPTTPESSFERGERHRRRQVIPRGARGEKAEWLTLGIFPTARRSAARIATGPGLFESLAWPYSLNCKLPK